jgi:D-tyrosyl-tRNA(Tyr) deacylase
VRLVIQRVSSAAVTVSGERIAGIGAGLLVLAGVGKDDNDEAARRLARKVAALRIFGDDDGRMNRSLTDVGGEALVVSQFTLYADTSRGRRPSFVDAAPPERGRDLYLEFVAALRGLGPVVATGEFGAMMLVESVNDGPVTIVIDTARP